MIINLGAGPMKPHKRYMKHFKLRNIEEVFESKIAFQTGQGIDRITPTRFRRDRREHCALIYRKCKEGSYRFSPYVEILKPKGRTKAPRVISYPTVRDRIVLLLLKEVLHDVFPECVVRRLPNNFVKDVAQYIERHDVEDLHYVKVDIENFYASIRHDRLMLALKKRIKSRKILGLVERAIRTPTVPVNYRKADFCEKRVPVGIPQGLAVSNILANIYLRESDQVFETLAERYIRYVDDIFFFVEAGQVEPVRRALEAELQRLDLALNSEKTRSGSVRSSFDYLGYSFDWPKVTVKTATYEKFLRNLADMIASWRHNNERTTRRSSVEQATLRRAFIEDVNEKITGAVSGSRRYGWIFYFLEMNDIELLFRMDAIIAGFFRRAKEFNHVVPKNLKRLVRAYHEARYDPRGGYIHDYDWYDSREKRHKYLLERGALDKDRSYTPGEIEILFLRRKERNLDSLERDVGTLS